MASYKFRVLIDTDSSEEVFRDIVISTTENFETFYQAILAAFEFNGQELASFYVSNENWDKGHEIALMDMGMSENLDNPSTMKDTIIEDLVNTADQKFILVHDFLRMWCFMIELNEIIQENFEGPMLDLSVGAAPNELEKEIDFNSDQTANFDLGNEIDDIFNDHEDESEFGGFENIDDFDL